MKILFPTVFYLPQVVGGIEYYIHRLARALVKEGYEVAICLPVKLGNEQDSYTYDGVRVICFQTSCKQDKISLNALFPDESLHNFKELLEREKPDIVHFNQFTNNNGISIHHIRVAREYGAKVVYTNHLSEFICLRGDFKYMGRQECDGKISVFRCTACLLQKRGFSNSLSIAGACLDKAVTTLVGRKHFLRQLQPVVFPGFHVRWHLEKIKGIIGMSDAFVSIANWFTDLLKINDLYFPHCVTVRTGIEVASGLPLPKRSFFCGERPLKIVFVGRIVPVKGVDILIKAIAGFSDTKVQLCIYGPQSGGAGGDTAFSQHCHTLAARNKNIRFYGQVDNQRICSVLSEHDIVCMPSMGNEMSPLLLQESLAAGVPVIGSSLPAIMEWITDEVNGFIFRVGDPDDLKSKINRIIEHPELLSAVTMNLPVQNSFSSMFNQYRDLYESLFHIKDIRLQ